ncbi:YDG domain-containing protein [Polynucleobacter necessarius]|uniref:YDG domain-containing protein n=1 Tax=Polynucleobacter necessarius TaxID=576610 RepID=UPI000FE23967|nr:YDG domain-containing protein [Polynucleobacter necessarius]
MPHKQAKRGGNSQVVSGLINANPTGYAGNLLISNPAGSTVGSGGFAGNYDITYTPGNLIVNKAVLTANSVAIDSLSLNGANFGNGLAVLGLINVTPKVLSFNDLGITGTTKPYDGSVYMTGLALTTSPGAFFNGDNVSALATGTFSTQNVGANLGYTVGITFSGAGASASNYVVSGGAVYVAGAGGNGPANGEITQLNSVTDTGPNGGNWSNPASWTTTGTSIVGAVPTQSPVGLVGVGTPNVANVIIPVGKNVVYDAAVGMPITSAVEDNGNLAINLPSAATLAMPISGVGSVTIMNTGAVTLSGNNSFTGGTTINSGATLIAGSNNAIAAGNIQSNGGLFGTASGGVTLVAVNATGSMTLLSSITTTGTQSYGDLRLATTAAGLNASMAGANTISLTTQNANISLLGTVDGQPLRRNRY